MIYTFMDFCAWIGCGRLGLELAWFNCVWFSEINAKAEETYRTFFGEEEKNYWDLMKINVDDLPDFDLLIAGFPCQTFSVIGQRKWMEDPRGQVILWIRNILKKKNIKYFILENVKWLVNHEQGTTIKSIVALLDEAGYYVTWKILNTVDYWLPQSRERVYFYWVRKNLWPFKSKLEFPAKLIKKTWLNEYLIEDDEKYIISGKKLETLTYYLKNKYNNGQYNVKDLIKKEWFIIDTRQSDIRFYNNMSPTLRTGRHGLLYSKDGKLREISWLESLLLQWIPYKLATKTINKITDKDLLWQAGNAMSVNVIVALWKKFLDFITLNNPHGGFSSTLISNSKVMISEWIWHYRNVQQLEKR